MPRTGYTLFHLLFAALALTGARPACAQNHPAAAASTPAESAHQHPIRLNHLKRLDERLSKTPEQLRAQCRFVSDISTAPPPGIVALSFDDGPEPGQTELILAVLAKHKVPATFFMIGEKLRRHPDLVAKVQAEPTLLIGNHSWAHPNFHDIDAQAQRDDILKSEGAQPLQPSQPGQPTASTLFRYPYGNSSCESNALLHERGYRIVGWHVDSCDWAFDKDGEVDAKEALSCGVLSQYRKDFVGHVLSALRARKGGIVLMHEIHPNTLAQLDRLIEQIKAEGFRFVRVDDPALQASMR